MTNENLEYFKKYYYRVIKRKFHKLQDIRIDFVFGKTDNGICGRCIQIRDIFLIKVYVDNILPNPKYIARTVIHELIHARQMRRGDLTYYGTDTVIWKGIQYKEYLDFNSEYFVRLDTLEEFDYINAPWEIEAVEESERILGDVIPLLYKNNKYNNYSQK